MGVNTKELDKQLAGAVRAGNVERVRGMILAGANVNSRPRDLPVLWYAREEELIRMLVDAGADVNIRWRGATLLHSSAGGDLKLVKTLLRFGADPNVRDVDGETPIFRAEQCGEAEITEYLAA